MRFLLNTRNLLLTAQTLLGCALVTSAAHLFAETATESVEARIAPVGKVCMEGDACAAPVVAVVEGPRTGKSLYDTKCSACHAIGVAGAPKFGDKTAWGARVSAKGLDGLFTSAWNGINAMPPKGTCNDCSEDEIKAAIAYMAES